jgi:hypothetical protein
VAVKTVNSGGGATYTSLTQAFSAANLANSDEIHITGGSSYTGQDLSHWASHSSVKLLNYTGGTVTITTATGTSVSVGASAQIGDNSGHGFMTFGLAGSPDASGAVLYVAMGKSLTTWDCSYVAPYQKAGCRIEGYTSDGSVTATRCTFKGYSSAPNGPGSSSCVDLAVSGGSTGKPIITATECVFEDVGGSAGTGINASGGSRATATIDRCTFKNLSWGIYIYSAATIDVRDSEFYSMVHWAVQHADSGNPTVRIYACTMDCSGDGCYGQNVGVSKSGVDVRGNWFSTMRVQQGAGNWDYNGYGTLADGTPGAHDYDTAADPGFTNKAGHDYSLTWTSELINKCGAWTSATGADRAGNGRVRGSSQDGGAFEYQYTDCTLNSYEWVNATTLDVTLISTGGTNYPNQTSAQEPTNWPIDFPTDPTIQVSSATRVGGAGSLTYRLVFNKAFPGLAHFNIDTDALILTDPLGGYVTPPPLAVVALAADCGIGDINQIDYKTFRVTFVASGGGGAMPDETSATDPDNWSGDVEGDPVTIVSVTRFGDFNYDVTLAEHPAGAQTLTLDSSLVETDQGGHCDDPGTGAVETEAYDCGFSLATRLSSRVARVTFAPEAGVGAPVPAPADATDAAKWTTGSVTGGAGRPIFADRPPEEVDGGDGLVYDVHLSRVWMAGEKLSFDVSAIGTDTGGTCGAPPTGTALATPPSDVPPPEGMLAATTAAIGNCLAEMAGRPTTRLRTALALSETTEVEVESTLNFPDVGTIIVAGERIAYLTRTPTTFRDLTRDPERAALYAPSMEARAIGAPVVCMTPRWSVLESALSDVHISTAIGDAVEAVAGDRGFARPLVEMALEDVREYAMAQYYLDRSVLPAIFRVLRPMFRWAETPSTGSVVVDGDGAWLVMAGWDVAESMLDRWVEVDERICRIKTVRQNGDDVEALLDAVGGALHQGHGFTEASASVEWSLVPFRVTLARGGHAVDDTGAEGAQEAAASIDVTIYATDPDVPFTYLLDDDELTPDDRPLAGKLLDDEDPGMETDEGSPNFGELIAPLYMLDPFADETNDVLFDVVAAGVYVRVSALPGDNPP